MSTHAMIGYTTKDGTIRGIYLHMHEEYLDADPIPATMAEAQAVLDQRFPGAWRVMSLLAFPGRWSNAHAVRAHVPPPGLYAPEEDQAIFRFGVDDGASFR